MFLLRGETCHPENYGSPWFSFSARERFRCSSSPFGEKMVQCFSILHCVCLVCLVFFFHGFEGPVGFKSPFFCHHLYKLRGIWGCHFLSNHWIINKLISAMWISVPVFSAVKVMDIDTVGTFNMCRASFEDLRRSKYGGVVTLVPVVRICSTTKTIGLPY